MHMSLFPLTHAFLFPVILDKSIVMALYYLPGRYSCQHFFQIQKKEKPVNYIAGCVYPDTLNVPEHQIAWILN